MTTPVVTTDRVNPCPTTAAWTDIHSIIFTFKPHANPYYNDAHNQLNATYAQVVSGTELDLLFEDDTRVAIKQDAIAIIRDTIIELMTPLAIRTTNKALVKQYIIDIPISSRMSTYTKPWRASSDIETTFLFTRKASQKEITINLDIDGLHFRPHTGPADFFDPKKFEDISNVPFPTTAAQDAIILRNFTEIHRRGEEVIICRAIHTQCIQNFSEMKKRMRQLERQIRVLTKASTPSTKRGTEIRIGTPDPGQDTRRAIGTPHQGQDTRRAILCSKPKLLSILWDEYQNGVGGRLPAKEFTRQQRGVCKAVYSSRKTFWDCMERLMDNGLTVNSALARINDIYKGSITQKLIALRIDERKGGHNQLCPVRVERTSGTKRKH